MSTNKKTVDVNNLKRTHLLFLKPKRAGFEIDNLQKQTDCIVSQKKYREWDRA